jgi:O-antigen ligase
VVFPKGVDLWNEREGVDFHDLVMALLACTGIVGLTLFAIFQFKFLYQVLRHKNTLEAEKRPYVAAMFGTYFSTIVWALAANDLWSNSDCIIIFYMLQGIIVRQLVIAKEKKLQEAV